MGRGGGQKGSAHPLKRFGGAMPSEAGRRRPEWHVSAGDCLPVLRVDKPRISVSVFSTMMAKSTIVGTKSAAFPSGSWAWTQGNQHEHWLSLGSLMDAQQSPFSGTRFFRFNGMGAFRLPNIFAGQILGLSKNPVLDRRRCPWQTVEYVFINTSNFKTVAGSIADRSTQRTINSSAPHRHTEGH